MERAIRKSLQETNVVIEEAYKDVLNKYGKKPWYFQFPIALLIIFSPIIISLFYASFTLSWLVPIWFSGIWIILLFVLYLVMSIRYENMQFKELNIKAPTNKLKFKELRERRLNEFYKLLIANKILKNDSNDLERVSHYIHLMDEEQRYLHKEKTPMLGASLLLGISIAIFPEFFKWILSKISEEEMILFWIIAMFIIIILLFVLKATTNIHQTITEYLNEQQNQKKEIKRWLELIKANLIN